MTKFCRRFLLPVADCECEPQCLCPPCCVCVCVLFFCFFVCVCVCVGGWVGEWVGGGGARVCVVVTLGLRCFRVRITHVCLDIRVHIISSAKAY